MTRPARPDFLIMGAPKAGTTALHAALTRHPDVFMSSPKEPKYWMCDDAPPPHFRGPGDQHSQQEWVWRKADYERLFEPAPATSVRGESTPFYLWHRAAQRRISEQLPDARLIAVVRDPIDRAYSNWMHLWSDGLEPVADFEKAFALEHERIAKGWAPFWRYAQLGRYGEQLAHLFSYVDRERVLVLRYRTIVDDPQGAVDRTCQFLGIAPGLIETIPHDNSRSFVEPGPQVGGAGPGAARGCVGRPVRAAAGVAAGQRTADPADVRAATRFVRSCRPRRAPACCRTSPTTSPCSPS